VTTPTSSAANQTLLGAAATNHNKRPLYVNDDDAVAEPAGTRIKKYPRA